MSDLRRLQEHLIRMKDEMTHRADRYAINEVCLIIDVHHGRLARIEQLEAENAQLREALSFYANPGDYAAPQTGYVLGGENKLWSDCGTVARAALAGKAVSHD